MTTIPAYKFSATDMEEHFANKPIIQLKMSPLHRPTYLLEDLVDVQSDHWLVMILDQNFESYNHHISITKIDDDYILYDLRYTELMNLTPNRDKDKLTKHVFKSSQEAQDYIVKIIKKDQPKHTWRYYFDIIEPFNPKESKEKNQ